MYDKEKFKEVIRERLSDYRYYHSLCVAKSARELAKRFGADEENAEIAGILHDVTKECSRKEHLEILEQAGVTLTDLELESKKFFHQVTGALYAEKELGITDSEILDAIRYHTTGRAQMSLMEQIVYLADFISDDRDYEDVDIMRLKVEEGRAQGMLYATRYTIVSVINKGKPLHPDTVDSYNWILNAFFNKETAKGETNGN